jgi:hypothetical protein
LLFPSPESSAKFPGPRLWEEIPFPSMVRKYPCRARNTFPGLIKKKSFLGNAQNFPLPAIVFFQDQTGKIPRKSWKPVSIFYSVSCEMPKTTQRRVFLLFEYNNYIQLVSYY